MKNKDIITLGNAGFFQAKAHSLPVAHFYKFLKFKRNLQKAYYEISKTQEDFMKEAGITRKDLMGGKDVDQDAIERYFALNGQLIAEDTVVFAVKIPFELYKGIYDENGALFENPAVEEIILNNLFAEPTDD